MTAMHWLFSYGTLRLPEVQQALFDRLVDEQPDTLTGYRLDSILVDDPTVVGLSGTAQHRILRRDARGGDVVAGAALALSDAELIRADAYETDAYVRVEATLASGRRAFVYVAPER